MSRSDFAGGSILCRPPANVHAGPRRPNRVIVSSLSHPIAIKPSPIPALAPDPTSGKAVHIPSSGVPSNWSSTTTTFTSHADQGDHESQFVSANILFHGRGVPVDRRAAKQYFQRAADGGHVAAQYQLADVVMTGWGISKDCVSAAMYFKTAAENGHIDSMYRWGKCLQMGLELRSIWTKQQIGSRVAQNEMMCSANWNMGGFVNCPEIYRMHFDTIKWQFLMEIQLPLTGAAIYQKALWNIGRRHFEDLSRDFVIFPPFAATVRFVPES
jgi:TPR repeat protein